MMSFGFAPGTTDAASVFTRVSALMGMVAAEPGATIACTGTGGGDLGPLADVVLAAPASENARVQEVHLATDHAICAAIEARITA